MWQRKMINDNVGEMNNRSSRRQRDGGLCRLQKLTPSAIFVYLPIDSCFSGVSVRVHLLRKNLRRNYSSIRSRPITSEL